MVITPSRRRCVLAVIVVGCAVLAGCGSSSAPGGANAMGGDGMSSGGGASASGDGTGGGGDAAGTITLTVDGATTSFDAGDCYLLKIAGRSLELDSHGLHASLPPDPGSFADKDYGSVILPPPAGGDEYRPTGDVHGRWSLSGSRASGHVEGVAHLLSGIGSGDDKDYPFSFDFECPYSDITGG